MSQLFSAQDRSEIESAAKDLCYEYAINNDMQFSQSSSMKLVDANEFQLYFSNIGNLAKYPIGRFYFDDRDGIRCDLTFFGLDDGTIVGLEINKYSIDKPLMIIPNFSILIIDNIKNKNDKDS